MNRTDRSTLARLALRLRFALADALIALGVRLLPDGPFRDAAAAARTRRRFLYRSSLFALGHSRNGNGRHPGPPV